MNKSVYWSVIVVAIYFMSCADNRIYFDKTQQAIITCNGEVIRSLYIDEVGGDDFYWFEKFEGRNGTNKFCLIEISNNYRLEKMAQECSLDDFELKPDREYRIRNKTFGDASYAEIMVKTNKEGKVIAADVVSCQ